MTTDAPEPDEEEDDHLPNFPAVRCRDCGRPLTWSETALAQTREPLCGRCLLGYTPEE